MSIVSENFYWKNVKKLRMIMMLCRLVMMFVIVYFYLKWNDR